MPNAKTPIVLSGNHPHDASGAGRVAALAEKITLPVTLTDGECVPEIPPELEALGPWVYDLSTAHWSRWMHATHPTRVLLYYRKYYTGDSPNRRSRRPKTWRLSHMRVSRSAPYIPTVSSTIPARAVASYTAWLLTADGALA